MSWFWCLEHRRVEQDFGCGSTSRIGPYETRAEAESALDRTRKRAAEQKARDAAQDAQPGRPARGSGAPR